MQRISRLAIFLLGMSLSIATPASLRGTTRQTHSANKPLLIAHRGASGYAPEHTAAAYKLAIEQGADFVEQDLQVTKDGVLICLHDPDLARTTNVAEVFPDRAMIRDPEETGKPKRGWYTVDFSLAEIKSLDAGSWRETKRCSMNVAAHVIAAKSFRCAAATHRSKAGVRETR